MKSDQKIVAVIPIKSVSERVESKNFREFYNGKSLSELLVEKLLKSKRVSKIYVSSDAIDHKSYFEELGCHFIERQKEFCNNETPWSDVIYEVISSIPESDKVDIAWCHTTSPLFNQYDNAIKKYFESIQSDKTNGLITVTKLNEFIISEKKQPINYSWGPWHRYSQDLEKLYTVTGALFIAKKMEFLKNRYVISTNPKLYEVSSIESIDIDSLFDFEIAKLLIKNLKSLQSYDK